MSEPFERCVCCYKKTEVPVSMPVDARQHYVEGAGQLCPKCWTETYGPPVREQPPAPRPRQRI